MEPPKEIDIMQMLKAGALYFAAVFSVGFLLGAIRTLWLVPRVGARSAELMEMPLMLVVSILAARQTVLRICLPSTWPARLGMGCIALVLMLVAEFGFVLRIRGLSIRDYLASRDPLSGTVYYLLLVVFGAMPLLVVRS
jgi:hypothetical protein